MLSLKGTMIGPRDALVATAIPSTADEASVDVDVEVVRETLRRKLAQGDITSTEAKHIMATLAMNKHDGVEVTRMESTRGFKSPTQLNATVSRKLEQGDISTHEAETILAQGYAPRSHSPHVA